MERVGWEAEPIGSSMRIVWNPGLLEAEAVFTANAVAAL